MNYFLIFIFIITLTECNIRKIYAVLSLKCPFVDIDVGHKVTDNYEVVYASLGETIEVPCCQRRQTVNQSWIVRDRFFLTHDQNITKIPLNTRIHEIGVSVNPNATLLIESMNPKSSMAYYCKRLQDNADYDSNTYIYFIDVLNPNQTTDEGGIQTYIKYKKKYLDPVNNYIKNSRDLNFKRLLQVAGLGMRVTLEWSAWSECNTCTGVRIRLGRCRLAPYVVDADKCNWQCDMYKYSLNVECASSWTIKEWFVILAEKIESIPNFRSFAKCLGPCGKNIPVKKRKTHSIYIGNSLTLTCPYYTPTKSCYWFRNGIKLNVDVYDPTQKVSVNEICTLYIISATMKENGNFTCLVENMRRQEHKVIVQENYVEKKESWWRHIKYLLYIVLTCFIILVGGIGIGCVQRNNFKRIDAEREIQAYTGKHSEYEKLLPKE